MITLQRVRDGALLFVFAWCFVCTALFNRIMGNVSRSIEDVGRVLDNQKKQDDIIATVLSSTNTILTEFPLVGIMHVCSSCSGWKKRPFVAGIDGPETVSVMSSDGVSWVVSGGDYPKKNEGEYVYPEADLRCKACGGRGWTLQ